MIRRACGSEADDTGGRPAGETADAAFPALLEESPEILYEQAPCGYLTTMMDGTIAKVNATLLGWLGRTREEVVGRMRFSDLLTVGGRIYHETHFAPVLRMQGEISGVALELKATDGTRMPVLASSVVTYGSEGEPLLIRTTLSDARDRRAYEEELLRSTRAAEQARAEAEEARNAAEEARSAAEHARTQEERARKEEERARRQAEQTRRETEQARKEEEQARRQAEQATKNAEQDRRAAELAREQAEFERRQAEAARRDAEADRARLQDALGVLQQSLLPDHLPVVPGLEAASYYHTASPERLGGDFYDLFPLDGKRWAFFLGDVCGKGPQAAALTSLTRYSLRAAALHDPDPVAALSTLNTVLHERYTGGDPRYCTTVFGTVEPDPDTGHVTVQLASGGHPPALIRRVDGRAEYLETPGGLLVGVLPEPHFTAAHTTLAPGDTLLLYTDGLTEARTGPERALYGDDALRDFVACLPDAGPGALVGALTALLEGFGTGLDDDTALLALGAPASTTATSATTATVATATATATTVATVTATTTPEPE
ncbi:PP2C family protein-serine/threonine phosphatase (plasmid) [Streptomyces sp. CA-294286]|uniref:PP2C family protein-serine/threonine phosphatase n=1 Tax=Streptomyces sp. CA-294286 TaxID=3240070 RepID=UPI003D8A459E